MTRTIDGKISYGDLPLHVRLLFLLVCVTGLSAIMHAFIVLSMSGGTGGYGKSAFGLSLAGTIGAMRMFMRQRKAAYWKAIALLLALPLFYVYQATVNSSLLNLNPILYLWWPVLNGALFLLCVLVVANGSTYRFYAAGP